MCCRGPGTCAAPGSDWHNSADSRLPQKLEKCATWATEVNTLPATALQQYQTGEDILWFLIEMPILNYLISRNIDITYHYHYFLKIFIWLGWIICKNILSTKSIFSKTSVEHIQNCFFQSLCVLNPILCKLRDIKHLPKLPFFPFVQHSDQRDHNDDRWQGGSH